MRCTRGNFNERHMMMSRLLLCVGIVLLILAMLPRIHAQEQRPPAPAITTSQPPHKTLGVLLFPGFEVLDAYGPLELWGNLKKKVRIVIIAANSGEIVSAQGPKTVADFSYENAPPLDLILVPGGMGVVKLLNDQATLEWLRARSAKAEIVMSVCNGASLLAAAGILDGRQATTNKMLWGMATAPGPNVKWVKQARWVDDGTVVTSSGVSAGMDMTVAVIARLYGQDVADMLARIAEYEPHRDPAWDPFARKAGLVE
jgi:transcriptional regulator GlxA family with amidase domain